MAGITQNKQKPLFSLWSLKKKKQQKRISEYRGKISNKTKNNNNKIIIIAIIVVIIIITLPLLIILINKNVNNNGNVIKESSHLIEEMLFKVMLESI